tara:strand:+ start:143 stop:1747 length:1605 start_codon:yes stop_codon:yes gene_type:complete
VKSVALKWIAGLLMVAGFSAWGSSWTPVRTDNPRDTMKTFMTAMNDYAEGVRNQDEQLRARIQDAIRCFAPAPNTGLKGERDKEAAAIALKETIDRVIVVDFDRIPEAPEGDRWRLKDTEIVLKPITQGERSGEWLITYDTWSRASHFFRIVKDDPYLEGTGKGAMYSQPLVEKMVPPWSKEEILGLQKWQWLGMLAALILGFVVKFFSEMLLDLLRNLSFVSKIPWKENLILASEKPLGLILATVFWYVSLIFLEVSGLPFTLFNGVIQVVLGGSLIWGAYRTIAVGREYFSFRASLTESTLDDQLVPFVEKTLKVLVVILGVLMVLQNMGINVLSLLAGLGLGGLAFALAAKDTAANLFGSIMILVDRPFKVGDWVVVGEVEGTVEEIGFRSTRVRTFYNSLISVPNSMMVTATIDNMGMRQYRRVTQKLGLTYDTPPEKLEAFVEGVKEILRTHENTRKDYFHVVFSGYMDSSLEILVYFFVEAEDWTEELLAKEEIFLKILKLAKEVSVEFAFPTRTVHVESGSEVSPLA